ncbi:profilin-like isoform X3 [Patiria miniata]|nr:profilin-like isoform X3 [Patiria miniata]
MKVFGAVFLMLLVVGVPVRGIQREVDSLSKKTTGYDGFIDQLITDGAGNIDRACIIPRDGGSLLSSSDHPHALHMTVEERLEIAEALRDNSWSSIETEGLFVEGQKYIFLGVDEDGIFKGLKIGPGGGGVIGEPSNAAIVVVHTSSSSFFTMVQVNIVLGQVVEAMKSQGL